MSVPEKKTLQLRLGKALRTLRERHRLQIEDVAERMGKKRSAAAQLSRWERGVIEPGAAHF